jgi:hypothetical protein
MPTKSRSSTTTDLLPNPHPGEVLLEELLKPIGLSQTALAHAIGVPPAHQRDHAQQTRHHRRYGPAARPLLRDVLGLQTDYELMARRREIWEQLKAIRPRAA